MSAYVIEKDWITAAGLRAVIIQCVTSCRNHRCGYVAVPPEHAAFGKSYSEQLPEIQQEQVDNVQVGTKSPILLFTAMCRSDDEESKIRRSLDILIEVHGGLTYSGGSKDYPVDTEEGTAWWFGYDCAHYDDDRQNGGRPLEYCIEHCENMAAQLASLKRLALPAPEAS